jgi:uncharacterized membrane protein YheB (UPF0754 family)
MKKALKSLASDFGVRWRIVCDRASGSEKRVFAGLELFCLPMSVITLFLLPGQAIAMRCGLTVPGWWAGVAMPILVSAAVGYITNYIAIEMLFKPYDVNWKHPLSLITFGYWKQGLVPKNKDQIGRQAGQQIQENLLNPEKISTELCEMVVGLIQDKTVIANIRVSVQELLRSHEGRIVGFLIPHIEKSLIEAINRMVTPDTVKVFWEKEIEPRLTSQETRTLIAQNVVAGLKRRSPRMIEEIRESVRSIAFTYLSDKLPLGIGAETLSNGLVKVIDWNLVEYKLKERLSEPETVDKIRDELLTFVERARSWMASAESAEKLNGMVADVKNRLEAFLRNYLHETLPKLAGQFLESESLWGWVENELLPSARPQIEKMIKETGREKIISGLNIAGRVEQAVKEQDVRMFHEMINSVAAQHLGAIQVLGYLLGGLVGLLQIFL